VPRHYKISDYDRKLEIVLNNLYGVDLDPVAVNLARLRLWLSLAVDFNGSAIPPLPNLDFKIEQGDSLLGLGCAPPDTTLFLDEQLRRYRELRRKYLRETYDKAPLRRQIETLRGEIAYEIRGDETAGGFDWSVEFSEVLLEGRRRGFDIIVANPPYVRQELIKEIKPALQRIFGSLFCGTADLYTFFYLRAIELLRDDGGMLAFISSNKWFRAGYGANLRGHIAETCAVSSITDFGELPVFEAAATFPMVFVARKGKPADAHAPVFTQVKSLAPPYPDVLALVQRDGTRLPADSIKDENWTLSNAVAAQRLRTMEKAGIPLELYVKKQIYRGVLTGFNTAFVITGEKRRELIAQDPRSAEIIKPLAVGDDVRRWRIEDQDRWLIVTKIGVDIKRYPAILAHLKQWQPELERRCDKGNHWWELRACAYYLAFDMPKIVFPDIAKEPRFAFDTRGTYVNNTTYFVPSNDLFLLGVLNSSAAWAYSAERLAVLGDADKGGRLRFFTQFVEKFPVPDAPVAEQEAVSALVRQCLAAKGQNCESWEHEINERVALLYGLDPKDVPPLPEAGRSRGRGKSASGANRQPKAPGTKPKEAKPAPPEPESIVLPTVTQKPARKPARSARRTDIGDFSREDLLAAIRKVFTGGEASGVVDRDTAIRLVARQLGFEHVGSRVREAVDNALRTAAHRLLVAADGGLLTLATRNIEEYIAPPPDRFVRLRKYLAAAMGPGWMEQDDAIRAAANHLGFQRTGKNIVSTFESAINSALRRGELERDGTRIRRCG
jgi:hypothetical protein